MYTRKAFTMLELIFVIVVLGILAAVALPKLAATRDDAMIVKGKSQIAAIRSGLAMQKAKNLLEGNNQAPLFNSKFRLTRLDNITSYNGSGDLLFNFGENNESNVLEYAIISKTTGTGGWVKTADNNYTFKMLNSTPVGFTYDPNTGVFGCGSSPNCITLTQ